MALRLAYSCVLLSLFSTTCAQTAASVNPAVDASSAPGVSHILDPAFAGFGIEPSNLFSYAGLDNPNTLSINLLQNLANYAGTPPHIRVGGNTGDQTVYDPSYTEYQVRWNANPLGQGKVPTDKFAIGPSYFKAISRFPEGTPLTYGMNLAYDGSDYLDKIVGQARACVEGLSRVHLVSFEIGNEPDLYLANGFRSGSWSGIEYTQEFFTRASAIYNSVLQPAGLPVNFFEPSAVASAIGTNFAVHDLVGLGILNNFNGSGSFVADYYFVAVSNYQLTLDLLMQLSLTEAQFAYWTGQIKQANATNLPFYLREMASAGPIGLPNITDTFGAALWTLNFLCYAASVNVASIQFHMTDNSLASPWQPIPILDGSWVSPHIRPSYYAFAAMAQLIGSGNGTSQIAAVPVQNISPDYSTRVRAYAAYTNGGLSAVVLINSMLVNAANSTKNSVTITLSLPNAIGETLYVSTLDAPGADSLANTTWNGVNYEESGDGTPVTSNKGVWTVTIDGAGNAVVTVRDSQAVIANIGYLLGTPNTFGAADVKTSNPPQRPVSASTSTVVVSTTAYVTTVMTTTMALAGSVIIVPDPSPTILDTSSVLPQIRHSNISSSSSHFFTFGILMGFCLGYSLGTVFRAGLLN